MRARAAESAGGHEKAQGGARMRARAAERAGGHGKAPESADRRERAKEVARRTRKNRRASMVTLLERGSKEHTQAARSATGM